MSEVPVEDIDIVAATPNSFMGLDPWRAYASIRAVGIRYVEVPALPPRQGIEWGQTTFSPEGLGADGTKRLADRLGGMDLTATTIAAFCDVLDPAQIEPLLRRIEFADALGAQFVLVDASSRQDLSQDEWRRLASLGRYLGDVAEDHGVRLAFEIHNGLTRTGQLAARLLDEIDHPAVGLNYDTANVIYYNDDEDPAEDIRHVAARVFHTHIKDTSGGKGDWSFGAIGDGHVDFRSIVGTLRSVGFHGPFSLEVEGHLDEDLTRAELEARIIKSLEFLRTLGVGALRP